MEKKEHIYGSNIPEARELLHGIAERLDRGTITKPKAAHDIEEIIENLMIRRKRLKKPEAEAPGQV